MRIAGAASALPKNKYDQRVLLSALKDYWGARLDDPRFLERLHGRVGVETRHLALPMEDYYAIRTWGDANRHWISVAEELGAETAYAPKMMAAQPKLRPQLFPNRATPA